MDSAERKLAAGLLTEVYGSALAKQPSLIGEGGDLTLEQVAAWEQFKASEEGRTALQQARYRIAWRDKGQAALWALSLAPRSLSGRGLFIEVTSPVEVIEWKWPLRTAVMEDAGYPKAQVEMQKMFESGTPWLKNLVHRVEIPAEQAGTADILIFPQGWLARQTLLAARAPVTSDLLVLCGLRPEQFADAANSAEELLEFTQANAVLAVQEGFSMYWLPSLVEALSHDEPIDVAAVRASNWRGVDLGRSLLLSTPLFIERARVSTFAKLVVQHLESLKPDHTIELRTDVRWLPPRMPAARAVELFNKDLRFDSELQGASAAAAVAAVLPQLPRASVPADSSSKPENRFLLHKITAKEPTKFSPTEALEAGKCYRLHIHVGRRKKGYLDGQVTLPEPPIRREDSGTILTVVFFEKNSKPEAQLKPIFLPRTGESSPCEFEFVASPASSLFEGWVSLYHNNRLLQEGVLCARVEGAVVEGPRAVANTFFTVGSSPRPLELGLAEQKLFAGAIRLEGDGTATGVRGYRTRRVNLPGLKQAVQSLEAAFNKMPWEEIGPAWVQNDEAAQQLALIAQEGWQIRQTLCTDPVFNEMEQAPEPILVYAADANVRTPLELCYMRQQPKSSAKICPQAAKAVAQGRCVDGCPGQKQPRDYVCPMGFWSLSKVIEWRSAKADGRDPEEIEVTNEPASGRRALKPLYKLLVARSKTVDDNCLGQLRDVLDQKTGSWQEVKSWEEWEVAVKESPTMLVLMPHVDNRKRPPLIEIQSEAKDPAGIADTDVVGKPPQQPIVLLLGCGAATSWVDFENLPAQFRRANAAAVLAPLAQLAVADAPEIAKALIEMLSEGPQGERPLGDVVLATKRRLVSEGKLAGLLLLAFGDADWLV